jgi:hypothetical protein
LVDRLAILVAVLHFPGMGVAESRPLRADIYVRMHHFVGRTTYFVPLQRFGGMCGESSCNVFLLLFMVLGVSISATLWRRAVLMLWHAIVV